jgi:hypothetical protein
MVKRAYLYLICTLFVPYLYLVYKVKGERFSKAGWKGVGEIGVRGGKRF